MTNNESTQDPRQDETGWDDDLVSPLEGIPCAECDARAYGPCVPGDLNSDWLCPEHAAAYALDTTDGTTN